MNIVLVNSEYPSPSGVDHGGIATYTCTMANALMKLGHAATIISKRGAALDELVPEVRLFEVDPQLPSLPVRPLKKMINGAILWEKGYAKSVASRVMALHRREPVDAVIVPDYNGLGYYFKKNSPFRAITYFHTPTYLVDSYNNAPAALGKRLWYRFERQAALRSRHFLCPSLGLKNRVIADYNLAAHSISCLPQPLDLAPFEATTWIKKKKDTFDILFVGRLELRKGANVLAQAMKYILAMNERVRFTLAGETETIDKRNTQVSLERSLTDKERERLYVLGPVNRNALPALYRQSDVLVVPSNFENAPYVILEAMASHLPVVGSQVTGINELIRHDQNGLLFEPQSMDGLLGCLQRLMEDEALAERIAEQAYQEIRIRHDPEEIARQTVDHLASLDQVRKTAQ
ncbi:MAG: glycosyltransferase [Chitinivibrionales bacterium]|nr:glycosyltransferase [Chitinivibrionales bacterium]